MGKMVNRLLGRMQKATISEHQTKELVTIDLITDDDTGMYSGDEFDFGLHGLLRDYVEKDPERKKRLAKFIRQLADNIESTEGFC